jgi:hypothetical protein
MSRSPLFDLDMTQKEKQLLLKDLCARLPYGVIVDVSRVEEWKQLTLTPFILSNYYDDIEKIKPYLRPMSSMTEKEKKEHNFYCGYKPYDENIGESYLTEYDMPDYIDFLYEHHLDFRGLIPMGLALEAPADMYKFE